MLGRGKRTSIGLGVKALRGVDENNLTLLGLKEGQQRLSQQERLTEICPVQGVQLLNRRIFKSPLREDAGAVNQYVERGEFLPDAVRQAFDGGVDIQIGLVNHYGTGGLAGDFGNFFQALRISANKANRTASGSYRSGYRPADSRASAGDHRF